ncbi:MFS family permease [Pseudoxanthomonas japonensis]|uniref:hypothetical protein n=1 Tax=Pseudoxanthomonas japonensis TaxID=69284 RepID=UPI00285BD383|nr:hypothetical protein [Pseudoxanthomonas japonensis]MDR7070727.1 MFS family permease [Pseudoxanthomonas japonensis]
MAEIHRASVRRLLVGVVGAYLASMGLVSFWMLAAGNVVEGHAGVVFAGVAFLVAAAPAIAFPFSQRVAKRLLLVVLILFAAATLWAVFAPSATPVSLTVKVAVLAFAILLVFRTWLALRVSSKPD